MKIRWDLLDIDVGIKELTEYECKQLVRGKRFVNQAAYEQYIVMNCITNFSSIVPVMQAYLDKAADDGHPLEEQDLNHDLYVLVCKKNYLLRIEVEGGDMHIERKDPPRKENLPAQKQREELYNCAACKEPEQTKKLVDVDPKDMLSLADRMNRWIVGQEEAVKTIHDSLMIGFTGLKPAGVPVGVFLFIGNSGIGKTYTAEVLNDCLIGDRNAYHKLDMSEYAEGHEYSKLIGASSGYIGHERGGILTNAVGSYPFCILLLDEIEEAHDKVRKIFLQVFDEGRLTDCMGNEVSFDQATIIMTTNRGTDKLDKRAASFIDPNVASRDRKHILVKEITDFLPKKFRNRIDETIFFRDLEPEEYLTISKLEIDKVTDILHKNRQIRIVPSPEVIQWIRDNGTDPVYGARPIKRYIKKHFSNPLSKMLLLRQIENGEKLVADIHNNKLIFEKDKI